MTPAGQALTTARIRVLRRRVQIIVTITITWNVIEAIIALSAGAVASSSALIAFGLDSVVEVLSAAAIAWQFAGGRNHADREHVALRVIAFAFFALATIVTVDAIRTLTGNGEAAPSTVGIALAATSLLVMPGLSWFERRTGRELGSAAVVADSKQTLICAALSGVLLAGLLMNSLFGLTWADPIAALVIAAVAVREGVKALRGDTCCTPATALLADPDADFYDACACTCNGQASCCARSIPITTRSTAHRDSGSGH